MKTTVKIYQIKDIEKTNYAFRSYIKEVFNFEDYEKVAEFKYEANGSVVEHDLEKIFELGNNGILQKDHKLNHSISMSDIIEIDNAKFYVNSIGFKLLEGAR